MNYESNKEYEFLYVTNKYNEREKNIFIQRGNWKVRWVANINKQYIIHIHHDFISKPSLPQKPKLLQQYLYQRMHFAMLQKLCTYRKEYSQDLANNNKITNRIK